MSTGDPFSKAKKLQSKPNPKQRKPQSLSNRYATEQTSNSNQTEKKVFLRPGLKKPPPKEIIQNTEDEKVKTELIPPKQEEENANNLHSDIPTIKNDIKENEDNAENLFGSSENELPHPDKEEHLIPPSEKKNILENKLNSLLNEEEDNNNNSNNNIPNVNINFEANQNLSKNGIEIDNPIINNSEIETLSSKLMFHKEENENEPLSNINNNINMDTNKLDKEHLESLNENDNKINNNENTNSFIPSKIKDIQLEKPNELLSNRITDANGNEFSNSNTNSNQSNNDKNIHSNHNENKNLDNKHRNVNLFEEDENNQPLINNNSHHLIPSKQGNVIMNKNMDKNLIESNNNIHNDFNEDELNNLIQDTEKYQIEISELKSQNSQLQAELKNNSELLESKDRQIHILQNKIDELNKIQNDLKTQIIDIAVLNSQLENNKETIETKNKQIEILEEQNEKLKQENQNLLDFINNYINNKKFDEADPKIDDDEDDKDIQVTESNKNQIQKNDDVIIQNNNNQNNNDDIGIHLNKNDIDDLPNNNPHTDLNPELNDEKIESHDNNNHNIDLFDNNNQEQLGVDFGVHNNDINLLNKEDAFTQNKEKEIKTQKVELFSNEQDNIFDQRQTEDNNPPVIFPTVNQIITQSPEQKENKKKEIKPITENNIEQNVNDIFGEEEDNKAEDIFSDKGTRKKSEPIKEDNKTVINHKKPTLIKNNNPMSNFNVNQSTDNCNDIFGQETKERKNSLFDMEDNLNKSETLPLPSLKKKPNFKKIEPPKPIKSNVPPKQANINNTNKIFAPKITSNSNPFGNDANDLFSDDKNSGNNLFD